MFVIVYIHVQLNTGNITEYADHAGRDADVERAWLQGVTGCGSIVTVTDEGWCTI